MVTKTNKHFSPKRLRLKLGRLLSLLNQKDIFVTAEDGQHKIRENKSGKQLLNTTAGFPLKTQNEQKLFCFFFYNLTQIISCFIA